MAIAIRPREIDAAKLTSEELAAQLVTEYGVKSKIVAEYVARLVYNVDPRTTYGSVKYWCVNSGAAKERIDLAISMLTDLRDRIVEV